MAERRYNDKELAEILRAAALAQAEGSSRHDEPAGYSIGDIERLASEVGIDPKHISAAVEALPAASNDPSKFRFWGAPGRQTFERTIDGTFDDAAWEEMVADLRDRYGYNGTASVVGSSLEWAGGNDFRAIHISLTPKNGKTRVRVAMRLFEVVFLTWIVYFVATFMASLVSGAFLAKSGFGSIIPFWIVAVIVGLWWTANRLLVRTNARETEAIEEVISAMAKAVHPSSSSSLQVESLSKSNESVAQPSSLTQTTSN